MARQTQAIEFNSFVGGLITEASPLTFPGNAALEINNFNLDKSGVVSRRLGMNFEAGYELITTDTTVGTSGEVAVSTFNWDNAGGLPDASLVVIQVGNSVKVFKNSTNSLSSGLIFTYNTGLLAGDVVYSAAVVDGVMVLATGSPELIRFEYDGTSVTTSEYRIKVRDFFGVEDVYDGVDLRSPENISVRPVGNTTDTHNYNLRNSTYATPRINQNNDQDGLRDPIEIFRSATNTSPSNADSVVSALFADPDDSDDRLIERFFDNILRKSPIGNTESPKGYFIIDALNRGTSRLEQVVKLETLTHPAVDFFYKIEELPLDRTPGGASLVSEFAGRMWYGGFSGEVVGGDKHSPKLSSYLFYSQLVNSPADLSICHQAGDPTSKDTPDLLDTDGGYIRLDGAYGIKKLMNIGSALVVVATNGVWAVLGGSDYGFTATDNQVVKVSEHGCVSGKSVVLADGAAVYWGRDGIYQVAGDGVTGDLSAKNLTANTVQGLYDDIEYLDKSYSQGIYDSFERKLRWLYGNRVANSTDSVELILDLALGAFSVNTITGTNSGRPNLIAPVEVPSYRIGETSHGVVDGGVAVVDNGVGLTHTTKELFGGVRQTSYVAITSITPTVEYTFAQYRDGDFIDWKDHDGVGVDAAATLITGYDGGGDFQRYKQDPYITFHFKQTEDGFVEDELGDIYPSHTSSCKVQSQWEWTNSSTSGRWGKEFQAYRHKRAFIPAGVTSDYDNGFSVVTTKNKLRGKGRVLSLQFKTEPLKDMKLLGWSRIRTMAENV